MFDEKIRNKGTEIMDARSLDMALLFYDKKKGERDLIMLLFLLSFIHSFHSIFIHS